jgi:hypothetical protein
VWLGSTARQKYAIFGQSVPAGMYAAASMPEAKKHINRAGSNI